VAVKINVQEIISTSGKKSMLQSYAYLETASFAALMVKTRMP
jgi:hypothetical protein